MGITSVNDIIASEGDRIPNSSVSAISGPDVAVRGAVINTTGSETGITVNGIVATVYGSQFIVNHVPLVEGQNTITAAATDTEDYTAATSIDVNAVITDPHVTLNANIESGIAPLETYFTVSTSIPNSVSNYDFDYEGDSTIDYTGTDFEDISVIYSTEGVYYPTITVTDDQSNTYTDTIAIVVLNEAELDALLQAKWEGMKTALMNQDVNGAVNFFTDYSEDKYREAFTRLQDQISTLASNMQGIELIYVKESIAKYRIRREQIFNSQLTTITYYIYFTKNREGIWQIEQF